MSIVKINGREYDTDDIIGYAHDGAPMFNAPEYARRLILSKEDRAGLISGVWSIGYSPDNKTYRLFGDVPPAVRKQFII